MDYFDGLKTAIRTVKDHVDARMPSFAWGEVTQVSPVVLVVPDNAAAALEASTLAPLSVGDRVWFVRYSGRVVIVGVAKGATRAATQPEVAAGVEDQSYVSPATLRGLIGHVRGKTRVGTVTERENHVPDYGDYWYDTDGDKTIWKGSSDGRWRRAAARVAFSSTGWNHSYTDMVARTESHTFTDMWLEPNEDLAWTVTSSGNGYEFSEYAHRSSNSVAETLGVTWRKLQVGSTGAQPTTYMVWIVERTNI